MSHLAHLDWMAVYLTCFGVGLVLSILSFAGGFLHLHGGHLHLGHGHHGGTRVGKGSTSSSQITPVNGFTVVAFFCWFGGTGYLLTRGGVLRWEFGLFFSCLSGTAGAGLIFWFLAKVLLPREQTLEPADTPMVGVLGRVSAAVPRHGVGEMLYSQNGARRSMAICSDDAMPIDREAEVVVLRYQRGIGYVRRWDELQQSLLGDDAPATRNVE